MLRSVRLPPLFGLNIDPDVRAIERAFAVARYADSARLAQPELCWSDSAFVLLCLDLESGVITRCTHKVESNHGETCAVDG